MPSRYLSKPKSNIGTRLRDRMLAASRACATSEPRFPPRPVTHRYVRWLGSRNARCAMAYLTLLPVAVAKRKRLRKETALHARSAIMPILSEVAPYDFRP
jgi:hypothetical protein